LRTLAVLRRHLALRDQYAAAGKTGHQHLFFLDDGRPISDPEITRWRWSESIKALGIRRRGPYHSRHSSVTWQLMRGKNLLWVAKQHGHSVEVMLRMQAARNDDATEADIHAIKQAMEKRPVAGTAFLETHAAIFAESAATNRDKLLVVRPLKAQAFGSSLAVGNGERSKPLNREQIKGRWTQCVSLVPHPQSTFKFDTRTTCLAQAIRSTFCSP
jgi:hypothetical protein